MNTFKKKSHSNNEMSRGWGSFGVSFYRNPKDAHHHKEETRIVFWKAF